MSKQMQEVRSGAVKALSKGLSEFIYATQGGNPITLRIVHAHTNQYRVMLPDGSEVFRLICGDHISALVA